MFSELHRAQRIVVKFSHFELLAMSGLPSSAPANRRSQNATLARSDSPGASDTSDGPSSPWRCHTSSRISTRNVLIDSS